MQEAMFNGLVAEDVETLDEEAPEDLGCVILTDHAMEQMYARGIGLGLVLRALAWGKGRFLRQRPLSMHAHQGVRVVAKRGRGPTLVLSAYRRARKRKIRKMGPRQGHGGIA